MTTYPPGTAGPVSIASRLDRLPITSLHRRAVAAISVGLIFELYEIFLAGVVAGVLREQFHMNASLLPTLLGSAFLGMFVGALALGRMADRFGRRGTVNLGISLYAVFSLLGAFSTDPWMLIATRFAAGLGIGAVPALADTYLSDLMPPKKRGHYIAVAFTVGYCGVPLAGFLGRWLVPLHPLGLAGWRWMFLIGALAATAVVMLRTTAPESPRWLESVGRTGEAEAIVARFETEVRGSNPSPSSPEYDSDVVRTPLTRGSLRDLLERPYGRRLAMMVVFQILQPFAYYGFGTLVPLILLHKGYTTTNTLLYTALTFLGYPVGSVLSLLFIERVERKHQIVLSGIAAAVFGICFGYAGSAPLIIVFGLCFTLVSNIFSNAYHIYQAEIFPTRIRATAVSWTYSLSRISSGCMPFILIPLLDHHGVTPLFLVVAACVITAVVNIGVFGPRTNGRIVGAATS